MTHVDLHLHSTASDGTVGPAAVVREAARKGLSGLSLTDHDTVDGLREAAAEADRLGLDFLTGAELSANEPGKSIHLLAYGFDPDFADLLEFVQEFRRDRLRRVAAIVERLNDLGVGLQTEDVLTEAGPGVPTRAHVARALRRGGWVPAEEIAFVRYIARGGPAFVEKKPTPPGDVIRLVHEAGGVVLLAHPGREFSRDDLCQWIAEGLDGLEILHRRNGPAERRVLETLARQHDLLRGGGSDWHGPDSGPSEMGSQQVPAEWLKAIAERCIGRAGG